MMKKFFATFLALVFFASSIPPIYASSAIPEMLCDLGIKLYQQGRYDEALHEFNKALMVSPNYRPAAKYIQMIAQQLSTTNKIAISDGGLRLQEFNEIPREFTPVMPRATVSANESLDLIQLQKEMTQQRGVSAPKEIIPEFAKEITRPYLAVTPEKKKKDTAPPKVLALNESLSDVLQPIDIEQGKSFIISGKNIQRFLVTEPRVITVERRNADELLLTGADIGYTYVHFWDDNGRWTTEWLTVFPKPEGPSYEETLRKAEEKAGNFKFQHTMDWSSFETGRRLNSLKRSTYSWAHGLSLTGETPYGNFDSSATIRTVPRTTDLTYFTVGLTDGQLGPFKGFDLRGFDIAPPFSNLAFTGAGLRGGEIDSPAFNNKLQYTAFWGREGGGRYGNLSPNLTQIKNSFMDGFNLSLSPTKIQNYKFSLLHAWGSDRLNYLNDYSYDLSNNLNFDNFGLGYEVASNSERLAQRFNTRYSIPKLNLSAEFRNISRHYLTITGGSWREGELGGLLNFNYNPSEKLGMYGSLDVYQDRLFPAEDNPGRLNQDFNWNANYQIDDLTGLNLNYNLQNDLGKLSQYRYHSPGIGINHRFKFIKDISTYFNYYHQENTNFSSHTGDYTNDRIYTGMRFSLIGELYYYLNKEFDWTIDRSTGMHSKPNALETGIDWADRIGESPFHGNVRFTYRNEEDTATGLSFLSGEDYIEGYTELSYQPNNDQQIYASSRVRNIWADNPNVNKRMEVSFNAGMRYVWDTGVRWESEGTIEGYVFRDLNSDGLRQRDEAPVEGVKLWLGKNKSQVTDLFGYYCFKGVRARKAFVNLDTSTLPTGYVLTVPVTQEVAIAQNRAVGVDFGIISRSEITGIIFEDSDGNGKFNKGDKGIQGVILVLENGQKTKTDTTGKYTFTNASTGDHTISLDLYSLPVYYLPKTAIKKELTLFEGVTYIYNIPLKRIEE